MRRLTLIAAASLATLALHPAVHAQRRAPQQLVDELQVEGNRRLSDVDIFAHVRTRAGDPFSSEQVQRDLQALLALPLLDKTATRVTTTAGPRGGVVVIFTVVELPVIRSVAFAGLQRVTMEQVLKALAEGPAGDPREQPYDPQLVRRAEWAIRELLARHGRPWASVTARVTEISPQSVELTFVVEEGERELPPEARPWRIGPIPLWREPRRLRPHPKRV